ncbi:hypothetical protein Tco_0270701 [Tanacetum coccineum]
MPMLLHTFPYILVDYASNSGALELTVSMTVGVGAIPPARFMARDAHQRWHHSPLRRGDQPINTSASFKRTKDMLTVVVGDIVRLPKWDALDPVPIPTINVEGTSGGNAELFGEDNRPCPPGAHAAKKTKSESSSGTAGSRCLRKRCLTMSRNKRKIEP